MKKLKLLPILLAAPLIASCGLSKSSEPKFADFGKELSLEKFGKALEKAGVPDKLDFNADKKLPSSVFESTLKQYSDYKLVRSEKEVEHGARKEETTDTYKLDTKNLILEHTTDDAALSELETPNESSADTAATMSKMSYQQETINKKKYVVAIDHKNKKYFRDSSEDDYKADVALDGKMKEAVSDTAYYFEMVLNEAYTADAKVLKHYKFYQNDKVFTIVFENEEVSNASDAYSVKINTIQKVQIDITKGNTKMVAFIEQTNEMTFKKSTEEYDWQHDEKKQYYKGETETRTSQVVVEASLKYEDVSLKKTDLKDFIKSMEGGSF